MTFHAVGLNHEHASVEQADAFALSAAAQESLYEDLLLSEEGEVVVLSTCNRTEAYLYGTDTDVQRVIKALERMADAAWPSDDAFRYRDEAAVRHVLQVTSGLRSMILGDNQILAQVKAAYQRAVDANQVHSLLHRLMHTAFRAAKCVSTETTLMEGAASVSTAAVEMARQNLRNRSTSVTLDDASVLLVGAGKMGRLALNALPANAPGALYVTNRSPDRARDVAETFDAEVVDWEDRHAQLRTADLVLVATGAPHPILRTDAVPEPPLPSKTLLVDIARPRNVAPAIAEVPGYEVCDLDDLNEWTDTVQARRRRAVPEAKAICEELLSDFVTWVFHQQALQPAIQAIRETFDAIREQEVERHAHRTGMDRSEVEQLTKSIMQKLLAVPIVRLKNVDPDSIDFVQGIKLLHALFA
ncbi:MAG: glutamyl-tRNA reductase, partial [Salinivenus sp.]